jgi:hypothetical protein
MPWDDNLLVAFKSPYSVSFLYEVKLENILSHFMWFKSILNPIQMSVLYGFQHYAVVTRSDFSEECAACIFRATKLVWVVLKQQ